MTGGPCGGKTSSLEYLRTRLQDEGYTVFVVYEVPSLLIWGGADLGSLALEDFKKFEANLLNLQLHFEETFLALADSADGPSVVIYDRGLMDPAAYLTEALWREILLENQWTEDQLCNARYDLVLHLTSAAIGAEDFYTTGDGKVRKESPALAAELDHKVSLAWRGHHNRHVVDNSTGFSQKQERMWTIIKNHLPPTHG